MPESPAVNLETEIKPLIKDLDDFHKERKNWDELVRREIPIELPPEQTDSEPVEYQSAVLEKDIGDHIEILRMNPTRFDIICYDDSKPAKEVERRVLLWMAHEWVELNRGRWWDTMVAEGQVRHGIKMPWLRWKPYSESDGVGMKKEDGIRKRKNAFRWSNTNLQGCYWAENDEYGQPEADVFFYRYTAPIYECGLTKDEDGETKKLTFLEDGVNKLGWVGLDEDIDSKAGSKQVQVTIKDYRDVGKKCELPGCDHPQRRIAVYVNLPKKDKEAELVEDLESPFPGCSFFLIGGRILHSETNLHHKYRPLMLSEYQEQHHQNYLLTTLATQSREAYGDQDVYAKLSSITAENANFVRNAEGGPVNSFDMKASTGPGKIPLLPDLDRFPKSIDPHLLNLINISDARMSEYRPNRFLTGNAGKEASNATGTAFLQQSQQAGMPYNGLLGNSDESIKKCFEYIRHAIRFLAKDDPAGVETRYYGALTGNETTARYSGKEGEVVWVSAKDFEEYDFDFVINTESTTMAEQGARWQMEKDKFLSGVTTPEQLIRDGAGIFDVQGQLEDLYAYRIRSSLIPVELELAKQYQLFLSSSMTGINFEAFLQQVAGQQQQQAQETSAEGSLVGLPGNDNMGRAAEQLNVAAQQGQPQLNGGSSPV